MVIKLPNRVVFLMDFTKLKKYYIIKRNVLKGEKFMIPKYPKEELSKKIECLCLPPSILKALKDKKIRTVGQLLRYNDTRGLYKLDAISFKKLKRIEQALYDICNINIMKDYSELEILHLPSKYLNFLVFKYKVSTLNELLNLPIDGSRDGALDSRLKLDKVIIKAVHDSGFEFISEKKTKNHGENLTGLLKEPVPLIVKRLLVNRTVEELLDLSTNPKVPHSIYKMKGIGEKTAEEIISYFHECGFEFNCEKEKTINLDTKIHELDEGNVVGEGLYYKTIREVLKLSLDPENPHGIFKIAHASEKRVQKVIDMIHAHGFVFEFEKQPIASSAIIEEPNKVRILSEESSIFDLNYDIKILSKLNLWGIKKIGKLLSLSIKDKTSLAENNLYHIQGLGVKKIDGLISYIHEIGFLFKEEKETIDLESEKGDLKNYGFTEKSINLLNSRYNIKNLDELLLVSLDRRMIRFLDASVKMEKEIIDHVHNLGYRFKCEEETILSLDTKVFELKSIRGLSRSLLDKTVGELLKKNLSPTAPNSLYNIPGVGASNVQKIVDCFHSYGILFECEQVDLSKNVDLNKLFYMIDATIVSKEFYEKIETPEDIINNAFVSYFMQIAKTVCKSEFNSSYTQKQILTFLTHKLIEHKKKMQKISEFITDELTLKRTKNILN